MFVTKNVGDFEQKQYLWFADQNDYNKIKLILYLFCTDVLLLCCETNLLNEFMILLSHHLVLLWFEQLIHKGITQLELTI